MCWRDTLAVLRALARVGFMVNLRKCKFLTPNAAVLGLDLCKWGYTLGLKFLGNLQNARIPTNLKELQKLVGQLLYATFGPSRPCCQGRGRCCGLSSARRHSIACSEGCMRGSGWSPQTPRGP